MAGVVYQGYASYLQAYQRHSTSYCSPSPSFSFNPYDKKYRLSEVCSGTSSPNIDHGVPQGYPLAPHAPSSISPEVAAAAASSTPTGHSVPSSVPPTSSTTGTACSSPTLAPPQGPSQSPTEDQTKTEEKVEDYADAHYLSANCVVLTYFNGDLAAAVDEHFSRALNQSYPKGSKEPCPMAQRNLPASFWNSQHQATYPAAGSHLGHDALYTDYSGFHGLPQPDPWTYNLTAAQQYSHHHHRSVSDFTYMPSSSRYSHNYPSLLMSRPRLPQCVVGKADPWAGAPRLHDEMALDPSAYAHHFTSMTGLEGSSSSQDHSKDLYWI